VSKAIHEGLKEQRIAKEHGGLLLQDLGRILQDLDAWEISKAKSALGKLARYLKRESLM